MPRPELSMRMTEKTDMKGRQRSRTLDQRPRCECNTFVKGETKQTQEEGETPGDWFSGLSNPRRCIPRNGTG